MVCGLTLGEFVRLVAFTLSGLFMSLSASLALAQTQKPVPYDRDFRVVSTPQVWSKGSQICFSAANDQSECAEVTDMGEIKLREGTDSSNDSPNYVDKLSPEQQAHLKTYDKFVVRYLAIDGGSRGRYIVQIFFDIGPGTQAIYVFGNYAIAQGSVLFEPMGYGDSSGWNLSFLRTNEGDQQAVNLAGDVLKLWAAQNLTSRPSAPLRP